ncbi:MAG: hypothetical protein GX639_05900 [Fibrobacter sp.]|nr:hypothetical protein [Fibrobacter sp.]
MNNQLLTECIPISIAAERYHQETPTLRKWVRDNVLPGIKTKPYQIHEPSLQEYLIKKANGPMTELFSTTTGKVSAPQKTRRN